MKKQSFEFRNKEALSKFKDLSAKREGRITPNEDKEIYTSYTNFVKDNIEDMIMDLRALRSGAGGERPIAITLGEYAENTFGIKAPNSKSSFNFLQSLGIDTSQTIESLYTTQSTVRSAAEWLVPEIVVDAIRMGIEQSNLDALIARTYNVNGLDINMPSAKMGEFQPKKVGEGARIPVGKISFVDKKVRIEKFGMGISLTDEVIRYTSIDMLAEQLRGVGRWFNIADNAFLIETLLNGEQSDTSYSAPIVGVATPATLTFKDMNRVMIRMANLELPVTHIVSNEDTYLNYSELDEATGKNYYGVPRINLNQNQESAIPVPHGLVPADTLLMVNNANAIARLVAQELQTEQARIPENQLTNVYITKSVGFAKLFRDAAVKLDYAKDIATFAFPDWMDIEALQARGYRSKF